MTVISRPIQDHIQVVMLSFLPTNHENNLIFGMGSCHHGEVQIFVV